MTVPLAVFFYLSVHPEDLRRLQDEVTQEVRSRRFNMRASYPVLDSIIKETLRLQPPVPNGAERKTPPLGIRIRETWIPGNVVIKVPLYTLLRGK